MGWCTCPSQVSATHTFTSGKRNNLEDLGIIQLCSSGLLRANDRKRDLVRTIVSADQFPLDATKNKFLDRAALARSLALQFAIEAIGDVYGSPHRSILPYLWLSEKDR